MDDLIIQSYWLLFDYIKPYLVPYPEVKSEPIMCDTASDYIGFNIIQSYDVKISFHVNLNYDSGWKIGIYQAMMELLHGHRALSSITVIFRNSDEYEIPLRVVQNMILAGKLTKDECIRALNDAECHEAVAEIILFDDGKEHGEDFKL